MPGFLRTIVLKWNEHFVKALFYSFVSLSSFTPANPPFYYFSKQTNISWSKMLFQDKAGEGDRLCGYRSNFKRLKGTDSHNWYGRLFFFHPHPPRNEGVHISIQSL